MKRNNAKGKMTLTTKSITILQSDQTLVIVVHKYQIIHEYSLKIRKRIACEHVVSCETELAWEGLLPVRQGMRRVVVAAWLSLNGWDRTRTTEGGMTISLKFNNVFDAFGGLMRWQARDVNRQDRTFVMYVPTDGTEDATLESVDADRGEEGSPGF